MSEATVESLYGPDPLAAILGDDEPPPVEKPPRRIHRRREPQPGETPKASREPKPAPKGRRESLQEIGTGLAKALAMFATNAGYGGAGRAFMLQSEAAGPAFDRAIKGSVVDRMLQPLARVGGNTKDLGALVGLPLATEAYLRDPSPMTQGAFQTALIASLPQIAAARKTAAKEQAKLEQDLGELAEMFGKDPGEKVTLNEVAMWLMTGSTDGSTVPPPPEPEPTY